MDGVRYNKYGQHTFGLRAAVSMSIRFKKHFKFNNCSINIKCFALSVNLTRHVRNSFVINVVLNMLFKVKKKKMHRKVDCLNNFNYVIWLFIDSLKSA